VSSQFKFRRPVDTQTTAAPVEGSDTLDVVIDEHCKSAEQLNSSAAADEVSVCPHYLLDDDGDLILSRRTTNHFDVIYIG